MAPVKRRQYGGRTEPHWEAMPVGHLILETHDFIVFLDKEEDIDWATTDEYDAANTKKKEQAADIRVKIIEKEKLVIQLNQAKGDITGMTITAPAEGMVIYGDHWAERRKIQVGDLVWSGR